MSLVYDTFETLRQQNAVLRETVALNTGIQLAAWYNKHDTITVKSNHHTLSLYVADGYESYQKTPGGWKNGGGPDRFCLMPEESESTWDIRDDLSFVHLYCTDEHLRDVGEKIWDKRPLSLTLEEKIFGSDPKITALYRQFLLGCDWQQNANQLTLSTASTLLLTHLVQHYSSVQWKLPVVTGGLSPFVLRNVLAFIEENLAQPLTWRNWRARPHSVSITLRGCSASRWGWRHISTLCSAAWRRPKRWYSTRPRRSPTSRWPVDLTPPAISVTVFAA